MSRRRVTNAASVKTLGQAVRVFLSRPGPRVMTAVAASTWTARALLGPPGPSDLVAAAAALAVWPLQEWSMHRYLLHLEPRTIAGVQVDPLFARRHRAHHADPRDIDRTLLPLQVVLPAVPVSAGLWLLALGPRRAAVTAIATYTTMALFYEWTHFIVHTGVVPRTAYGARVRKNHRLHHFRDEHYWLGFTVPAVDRWFGTSPDPAGVPRSRTAMDLHGLEAARAAADSRAHQ